jgi:hypothetical protein
VSSDGQYEQDGRMWAAEKVVIGLVGTTLRGTATGAGLLESKLLDLERENFIYPFGETFLLRERESKESRPDNVPVDCVEERGKHPWVVIAEIDAMKVSGVLGALFQRGFHSKAKAELFLYFIA